jgi:hypothetical protein
MPIVKTQLPLFNKTTSRFTMPYRYVSENTPYYKKVNAAKPSESTATAGVCP